ncbi:uncharacterized protein LACBIDRAFT_314716 [Laccaria bicolor S238N-H82]|uniref:Predicted protein n=1 Tax=Laccaria bicolor (strain S238N-H82 / ATCC MYA-4686) TaxID=486041 RepID=B0DZ33_LACBS|nr:uncharacterized protein LACBIDRAFT_314716 [Laccaria bicolor S238N-H82]EDR00163.1 predicted protein [Laccaria bicolor S238N-H82]|eukprot:XP_001889220.1 predicted protein [Laccaria bicolor S238N-H82]
MKSSIYLAGALSALTGLQSTVASPVIFQTDGTFKLTVFSDLHFGENPEGVCGPEQAKNSTMLMKTVFPCEKSDYVHVLLSVR